MRSDGTHFFGSRNIVCYLPCRYHSWVNVEALLEACFIGVAAPEEDMEAEEGHLDTDTPRTIPKTTIYSGRNATRNMSIVWDEANIAATDAERGVEYGTQKIELPETPFLCAHPSNDLKQTCSIACGASGDK